jgi:hypothetical protein
MVVGLCEAVDIDLQVAAWPRVYGDVVIVNLLSVMVCNLWIFAGASLYRQRIGSKWLQRREEKRDVGLLYMLMD